MALVDLKSDLSWYSAKGEPRGYRPNPDKQSTDFVYNDDLTLSARPKGFDNAGFAAMFPAKTTADVVPSPTSLSVVLEISTSIFAAGC